MISRFSSALLYRIANYYYTDGLSQNEIAEIEHISRSTVSRALDRARETGIVKIEISLPTDSLAKDLEEQLKSMFGLKKVIVAPASVKESSYSTEQQLITDVAVTTAAHMYGILKNAKTIGVGWGRTVYNVPAHLKMPTRQISGRTVVPLVGNMALRNSYLQTSINVSRFSEALGAQAFYLNISNLRDADAPYSVEEQMNIKLIEEQWNKLDVAIFSLGAAPANNILYLQEELVSTDFSDDDLDSAAKGEILSQTIFSDDRPASPIGRHNTVIAFPLEKLKDVKTTILLAASHYKAEPVYWAIKKGYCNTLVVDHLLAMELVNLYGKYNK